MYILIKQDGSTRGEGLDERYNTIGVAIHGDGYTSMSISNSWFDLTKNPTNDWFLKYLKSFETFNEAENFVKVNPKWKDFRIINISNLNTTSLTPTSKQILQDLKDLCHESVNEKFYPWLDHRNKCPKHIHMRNDEMKLVITLNEGEYDLKLKGCFKHIKHTTGLKMTKKSFLKMMG